MCVLIASSFPVPQSKSSFLSLPVLLFVTDPLLQKVEDKILLHPAENFYVNVKSKNSSVAMVTVSRVDVFYRAISLH